MNDCIHRWPRPQPARMAKPRPLTTVSAQPRSDWPFWWYHSTAV